MTSAKEIMEPTAPFHAAAVQAEATRFDYQDKRLAAFGSAEAFPENQPPRHLAASINLALADLLIKYPEALVFGEDVAQKGGVYHVTTNLLKRFGPSRVFNTILDEQTILGLAQGFAYMASAVPGDPIPGLLSQRMRPDPRRSLLHAVLFPRAVRNPMVLRIASLAYQKGFGGHFHNDNSIAALRDIPGLVIACPSRADDAVGMLRTAAALARVDGRVVAYLEPIALYMTKDLHSAKDSGWQFAYPPPDQAVPLGEARAYHETARDLAIVTYGNGAFMSLQAARRLQESAGIGARVVDLRWLNPLNVEEIARHAAECGRVLVVDEDAGPGVSARASSRPWWSMPAERDHPARFGRDTYIPLGPAANLVLPQVEDIVSAALQLFPADSASGDQVPAQVLRLARSLDLS